MRVLLVVSWALLCGIVHVRVLSLAWLADDMKCVLVVVAIVFSDFWYNPSVLASGQCGDL
jgi:hypothetical protein